MRIATLLLCLSLAACAGITLPSEPPPQDIAIAPAAARAPIVSAPIAAVATAPAQPVAAAAPQTSAMSDPERLQQARVDCWAKVERQGRVRDIDRRIAFVDKCLADELKSGR